MKFKLDENIDRRLVPLFTEDNHDVATVRGEGLSEASDDAVFRAAMAESRTLVTLDLDFANPLRFPPRETAGTVVVRVPRPLLRLIEETLRAALPQLKEGRVRGRLWIVEPGRIREYSPDGAD
ncbi:MAG: DUF5615 family PIN-like protein [Myxococcota bacterium]|nr:DUF5615 family PIN-like protein [Myxococcota bacterium]